MLTFVILQWHSSTSKQKMSQKMLYAHLHQQFHYGKMNETEAATGGVL